MKHFKLVTGSTCLLKFRNKTFTVSSLLMAIYLFILLIMVHTYCPASLPGGSMVKKKKKIHLPSQETQETQTLSLSP